MQLWCNHSFKLLTCHVASCLVLDCLMKSPGYQLSSGLWGAQPSFSHPINQVSSMFPLTLANLWSWEGRRCLQLVRWHRWLHSWHWVSLCPWQSPWISQGGLQGVLSCHQPLPTSSGTGGGPIRENHHRPEPDHGARTFISQRTPGYKLLGKENEGC